MGPSPDDQEALTAKATAHVGIIAPAKQVPASADAGDASSWVIYGRRTQQRSKGPPAGRGYGRRGGAMPRMICGPYTRPDPHRTHTGMRATRNGPKPGRVPGMTPAAARLSDLHVPAVAPWVMTPPAYFYVNTIHT